jgi:outer membrane protein
MKHKCLIILTLFSAWAVHAQQSTDTLNLSLAEAVRQSLNNNPEQRNSLMEVQKAKYKVNEITGYGLPQVGASFEFRDQFELPVFVFPDPVTGEQTPIQVGTKYQNVAGLSLNQLIFDGTYLLGLKAAKEYVNLAQRIHEKNERDLMSNVIKSYYLVLISKENKQLIEQNLETLRKTLTETTAMYKEGFVEELDVDRIKLAVSNLEVQYNKIQNQVLVSELFLKNILGISIEQPLKLTTDLNKLNQSLESPETNILTENVVNRSELRILEQQYEMNKLEMRKEKISRYPTIRGFLNYQEQNFSDEIKFNPWYSTAMWGVSVNIPIFDGGSTKSRINQTRLSMMQMENTMQYSLSQMRTEFVRAKQDYLTAIETAKMQKANFELAQKIFKITETKYKEGVGTNLELINANQELKTAQTNYLNSVYDLLVAKLNVQIASGQSIKQIEE